MRVKRTLIVVLSLAFLCALIYFGVKIYNSPSTSQVLANSHYIYSENFDKVDSAFFKKDELKNIVLQYVIKSSYRNNIRVFKVKNSGILYLFNIDLDTNLPMDQFIQFQQKISEISTFHPYLNFSIDNTYDFEIIGEKVPKVKKVICCLTGNQKLLQKKVYTKNFISYYLPVSTFSVRYAKKSPVDIFFGGNQTIYGSETYPLMISFYKRLRKLYILILIPDKNEMNLDGGIFGKIINYSG